MNVIEPKEVIHTLIHEDGYFPGNPRFPLLIYKQVLPADGTSPQKIQDWLAENEWSHAWIDQIYDFHHYHSNTHEVLAIIYGSCDVQFGGENGLAYTVTDGDLVIIPAGVSHKSLKMHQDFQCIGAYPLDVGYDMNTEKQAEYVQAVQSIKQVGLPNQDPLFGSDGLLFNYWK